METGRRVTTPPSRAWTHLALAGVLGLAIGWSALPAWLPSVCVLAAVVLGLVRPAGRSGYATALTVLLVTATVVGAATEDRALESAALAASAALAHAAAIALPLVLVELVRRRRRHRDQGWELARSLAREEHARTESALAAERAAMAGDIHDNLGHRLILVSVQLGRLSLDPQLPESSRAAVEEARLGVAEAAAELGETVQLLTAGRPSARVPADRLLPDVVATARSAGVAVESDLAPDLDHGLSAHARAALTRVLSEALANAAKHAPGAVVRVSGEVRDGRAVLTVANARRDDDAAPGAGHGLPSLHHRLALLRGRLEVVDDGEEYLLRAVVPVDAVPAGDAESGDTLTEVSRSRRAAAEHARRAGRLAWAVPLGLAGAAVLVTVAGYVALAVVSVLPPDRFAEIEVGMSQDAAERVLPAVEMIEAPRDALPEPDGATCRFHESEVSLFAREDVYRICFAGGVVVSADTIPSGTGAP